VLFAVPTSNVRAWRLAAWVVSAAVFAAHVAYERFRLQSPPSSGAQHVTLGVALGAFGLAAAANIHALAVESTTHHRRLLLVALVIWPVITSVPAFLLSLAASWALRRHPEAVQAK